MGKQKNRQQNSSSKLSQSKRNELKKLTDAILIKSREKLADGKAEFQNYIEINELLEKIIKIESEIKPQFKSSRSQESATVKFIEWCKKEGAKFPKIELKNLPEYDGFGLIAREPLKKDELFIEIPESMIFSFDKIQEQLPDIFKHRVFLECPLLDNLSQSHVRLAVALIIEKLNPESKWKPYLDLLPEKFRTVLYYSVKEMEELRGTMALSPALKQVKYIAAQYAFLYKYLIVALENDNSVDSLRDNFTFEFYRWATSTVMTRQNVIPREQDRKESVLIPLWDMCNHVNGTVNTQYNDETRQIESFCLEDFSAGNQVTMAYGNRCNQDFLIHNGFVNVKNDNMDLFIKLSLSKSDELYDDRTKLLQKLNLEPVGNFQVSPYFSDKCLGFVRVFNMNKEMLKTWLEADNAKDLLTLDLKMDSGFEQKVSQFLLMRIKILLRAFPTSLEEDKGLLETPNISKTRKMLIQYRMLEKQILHEVESKLSIKA